MLLHRFALLKKFLEGKLSLLSNDLLGSVLIHILCYTLALAKEQPTKSRSSRVASDSIVISNPRLQNVAALTDLVAMLAKDQRRQSNLELLRLR